VTTHSLIPVDSKEHSVSNLIPTEEAGKKMNSIEDMMIERSRKLVKLYFKVG